MRLFPSCLAVLFLAVAACTPVDRVHRLIPPEEAQCHAVYRTGERNLETAGFFAAPDHPTRCFLQRHELPFVADENGRSPWAQEAAAAGRSLADPDRYDLAFVEMSDANRLQLDAQLDRLMMHLADDRGEGRQAFVVAYVHGWRHDAAIRDGDLQKFRRLLGYSRAALNSRCIKNGQYCSAALTGVFVSWRGRSFAEPPLQVDGSMSPFIVGAVPTFWDRRNTSTRLGNERGQAAILGRVLDRIQGGLRLGAGDPGRDKMLVFGHSLGGNMLATLMESRALNAIERQPLPAFDGGFGPRMKPILGDLVVLLNPASEARKWTSLQRAERARAGFAPDENHLASYEHGSTTYSPRIGRKMRRWRGLYPLDQRPVYMAITSVPDWGFSEGRQRKTDHDEVTKGIFALAQKVAGIKGAENQSTIGHLTPRYLVNGPRWRLAGDPVGTSHELAVLRGAWRDGQFHESSYGNAADPNLGWCDPANGWLIGARKADGRSKFGHEWEYGLAPEVVEGLDVASTANVLKAAENIARGRNGASVQWRHALYLPEQRNRLSVATGTSPFWNVRALDTAIRRHDKWASYPTWCAINQLVLDDITSQSRTDAEVRALELMVEQIEEQKPAAEGNAAVLVRAD
jgi:hypothetical protein